MMVSIIKSAKARARERPNTKYIVGLKEPSQWGENEIYTNYKLQTKSKQKKY